MIFETAVMLTSIGLVLYMAGYYFDRPELAMFGAIIIIGIGAAGVVDGYEVRTGEEREITNVSENETVEVVNHTYEDVEIHGDFPLPIVVLLLGAVMLIGAAGEASETTADRPPWER